MKLGHGWFNIYGIQTGEYDIKDRLYTFDHHRIRKRTRGASILDLGCAEGLISKWLIDACGSKSVHGLDKHQPYVDMARKLMRTYDAKYEVCDFDHFVTWRELHPDFLSQKYDLVLLLRVLQKIARPAEFLKSVTDLVGRSLIIQVPQKIIDDERSRHVPFDVEEFLSADFVLKAGRVLKDGEFTGLFDRKQ